MLLAVISSPECKSRSQRICPFWTCFSKMSTEDMLVRVTVDAERYFLLPMSQLPWNETFSRKAVLPRHAKNTWLISCFSLLYFSFSLLVGIASALLASAWVPSSSQRGLGWRSVRASFWCGACARTPEYHSLSVQAHRLNSAATHALGVSLGELIADNYRHVALCLLAACCLQLKTFGWERASVLLVTSTCSRLYRTYAWGTATGQLYFAGGKFL
jgi:hypothetical protein